MRAPPPPIPRADWTQGQRFLGASRRSRCGFKNPVGLLGRRRWDTYVHRGEDWLEGVAVGI